MSAEFYKDQIIELCEQGKSMAQIATVLEIGSSTVSRHMKTLGLKTKKNRKQREVPLNTHTNEIIELYQGGMGCHVLSKKYDCEETSIIRLLRKNGLKSNKHQLHHSVNKEFFDNIDTENKSYVYGFFVGDGCNQKNGVVSIGITDYDILADMKKVMGFTGPIEHQKKGKKNRKQAYRINVCSKYMSERLSEIHCPPRKTYLTKFPSSNIVPDHLIHHFVRGLFDADGSFHNHTYTGTVIATLGGTLHLMEGIKDYVKQNLNIDSYIYPHGTIFLWRINKREDVTNFSKWLYKDATICLQRKKDKITPLLDGTWKTKDGGRKRKVEEDVVDLQSVFSKMLNTIDIKYETNFKTADFFIPSHNIIIETVDFRKCSDLVMADQSYYVKKRQAYVNEGYTPLFFHQDEILNKSHIIKSIIQNKLGQAQRIGARQCELAESTKSEGVEFVEDNHLMGKGAGDHFVLKYNGEIVSCMCVKRLKENDYEISRFCNKIGYSVMGAFTKLIKAAQERLPIKTLVTFIDRRYGKGNYLEALGFAFIGCHKSFKWTNGKESCHRMRFKGNTGYDEGWAKIFDCGQAKYLREDF